MQESASCLFFGAELDGELVEIDGSVEGIALWGLVGKPSVARPTSRAYSHPRQWSLYYR